MKVIIKSILYLLFLSESIVNSIPVPKDAAEKVKVENPVKKEESENTGIKVTYKIPKVDDLCKDPKEFDEAEKTIIDEEAVAKNNNNSVEEQKLEKKYNNNDFKTYKEQYDNYLKNLETEVPLNEGDRVIPEHLAKNPTDIVDYKLQKANKGCY